MSHEALFEDLALWRELGWLRGLEEQFVRFLARLDPQADPDLLLMAGLASHQLGRGHVCLPLAPCLDDPQALLALPPDEVDEERRPDPEWEHRKAEAQARLTRRLEGLHLDALKKTMDNALLVGKAEGNTPLVFDRGNLYLRRTWRAETDIALAISARQGQSDEIVPPAVLGELIRDVFGQSADSSDSDKGIDWQKVACALAVRNRFTVITGGPGTGKTWTVVRIIALLQRLHARDSGNPLRIRLAAPTGKAAQRLSESIDLGWQSLVDQPEIGGLVAPEKAATLHRLLGSQRHTRHFRHNHDNPLPADVVIVDEASMIDLHMMHCLLDALAPHTRLVLLGDKDQLASVEPGAVFGDLCTGAEDIGFDVEQVDWLNAVSGETIEPGTGQGGLANQRVMLRQTRRFNQDIAALARAVNSGLAEEAAGLLDERAPALNRLKPASETDGSLRELFVDCGYARYLDIVGKTSSPTRLAEDKLDAWIGDCLEAYAGFQVLTATRTGPWGVEGLNARIRQWLAEDGLVDATGQWFHGRPVMIVRNDYRTGLMNGDVGLCLALPHEHDGSRLRVVFRKAGGELRHFSPARMPDCQTAWAMTVHKAQGSEFKHTVLVLPERDNRVLTRELVYTGLTRARSQVTVISPKTGLFEAAVERRTQRRADGFGFSSTD